MSGKPAVLLAGPTASGKSAVALRLAEQLGGVVVNSDSMQVYRDLRVLTARPTEAEEALQPHRLYGHVDAGTNYSVGRYVADATACLEDIDEKGLVPIFCGGTGLYVRALVEGLSAIPPVPDAVRAAEMCIRDRWQVDPARPQNFVFNIQDPEGTIKAVAESAMREVIGRRNIQAVLTTDRAAIESEVLQAMQTVLDTYQGGVRVRAVQLQKVDPPSQVIDAFRDVQAARQDQDRVQNEAQTYASRVVPEARGEAARLIQQAEAYKERTVQEAQGAASRFTQVYEEYRKAPDVTRQRMFLETMERVLGGTEKVIIDQNGGQGVVPYLPLNELPRRPANAPANTGVRQ